MSGLWYLIIGILLMWQLIGLRVVTKKPVENSVRDIKSVDQLKNEFEKATTSHKARDEYIRKIALENGYSNNEINKAFKIATNFNPNSQIKMLTKLVKSPEDAFAVAKSVPLAKVQKMMGGKSEKIA